MSRHKSFKFPGAPLDCIPKHKDEYVCEIIEGPDREGKHTFFLYWMRDTRVHRQIFRSKPSQHMYHRLVDRRK